MHHHRHTEEERRKWQNPEQILKDIGLMPGMTFADIGCGRGFFAIPAAKIVGKTGEVVSVDSDEESVEALKERAKSESLGNVQAEAGKAEKKILCDGCADIVFFGQCLHDFQDPLKALINAKKTIKPKGILADLDWKNEKMELGPPYALRFSEEHASDLIKSSGFEIAKTTYPGPYHYLIIAKKKV